MRNSRGNCGSRSRIRTRIELENASSEKILSVVLSGQRCSQKSFYNQDKRAYRVKNSIHRLLPGWRLACVKCAEVKPLEMTGVVVHYAISLACCSKRRLNGYSFNFSSAAWKYIHQRVHVSGYSKHLPRYTSRMKMVSGKTLSAREGHLESKL